MARKPLFWQLFPKIVLITLATSAVIGVATLASFQSFYYKKTAADLEARARLIRSELTTILSRDKPSQVDQLCKSLGSESGTRFTVILPNGQVVGDTNKNPGTMDNHALRPEVSKALQQQVGTSVRYSNTLKEEFMYVALPVTQDGVLLGVVRSSIPLSSVKSTLWNIYFKFLLGGLALLIVVGVVSWRISRRISSPLDSMKALAQRIAHGDFTARMNIENRDSRELQELGQAMDDIAIQLDRRIQTILRQKAEQDAVFSSMGEGVLAVDKNRKIRHLNHEAATILGLDMQQAQGNDINRVLHVKEILSFIEDSLNQDGPTESDLELVENDKKRYLQVRGNPLKVADGSRLGAVLIFSDVTRIRQLEKMRRDFVANVSHELRTPLTSIQGFAETLMNPSVKDPEEIRKFLEIIHKHSARLGAIIEDLLALSRLERETESNQIELAVEKLRPTLVSSIEVCENKAQQRNIQLNLDCEDGLSANINPSLLQQAVVNLVDNAIKFSEDGDSIDVHAFADGKEVKISVTDHGAGIQAKHLPRLFERFYRIDKARSRKAGGTGLGLSIVKHVSLAHQGNVDVTSEMGKGSTFTIHLPLNYGASLGPQQLNLQEFS